MLVSCLCFLLVSLPCDLLAFRVVFCDSVVPLGDSESVILLDSCCRRWAPSPSRGGLSSSSFLKLRPCLVRASIQCCFVLLDLCADDCGHGLMDCFLPLTAGGLHWKAATDLPDPAAYTGQRSATSKEIGKFLASSFGWCTQTRQSAYDSAWVMGWRRGDSKTVFERVFCSGKVV